MVETLLPQFGYQLQLSSGVIEERVKSVSDIRQLLIGIYGGRGPNNEPGFDPRKGYLLENLDTLKPSPLLDGKVSELPSRGWKMSGFCEHALIISVFTGTRYLHRTVCHQRHAWKS